MTSLRPVFMLHTTLFENEVPMPAIKPDNNLLAVAALTVSASHAPAKAEPVEGDPCMSFVGLAGTYQPDPRDGSLVCNVPVKDEGTERVPPASN